MPGLERLVGHRERDASPAGSARPEALARRDGDPVLDEQPLRRQPVGKAEPDVERPFAHGRLGQRRREPVAAALVGGSALLDAVLRAVERRDRGLLERGEDPDARVVAEQVDPLDDLGVPEDEPQPPARHPEGLGHRPELDSDVLRPGRREEALGLAAVEDEVVVGRVVDDRRPRTRRRSRPRPRRAPGPAQTAQGFDGKFR